MRCNESDEVIEGRWALAELRGVAVAVLKAECGEHLGRRTYLEFELPHLAGIWITLGDELARDAPLERRPVRAGLEQKHVAVVGDRAVVRSHLPVERDHHVERVVNSQARGGAAAIREKALEVESGLSSDHEAPFLPIATTWSSQAAMMPPFV